MERKCRFLNINVMVVAKTSRSLSSEIRKSDVQNATQKILKRSFLFLVQQAQKNPSPVHHQAVHPAPKAPAALAIKIAPSALSQVFHGNKL